MFGVLSGLSDLRTRPKTLLSSPSFPLLVAAVSSGLTSWRRFGAPASGKRRFTNKCCFLGLSSALPWRISADSMQTQSKIMSRPHVLLAILAKNTIWWYGCLSSDITWRSWRHGCRLFPGGLSKHLHRSNIIWLVNVIGLLWSDYQFTTKKISKFVCNKKAERPKEGYHCLWLACLWLACRHVVSIAINSQ